VYARVFDLTKTEFKYASKLTQGDFSGGAEKVSKLYGVAYYGLQSVVAVSDLNQKRKKLNSYKEDIMLASRSAWELRSGKPERLEEFMEWCNKNPKNPLIRDDPWWGEALGAQRKEVVDYQNLRRSTALKLGKNAANLASIAIGFLTDKDNAKAAAAKQVLDDVGYTLDRMDKVYESCKELQGATTAAEKVLAQGARVVNGALAVAAAWDLGQDIGKSGVMLLADPLVAKAYMDDVRQFDANGGWLAVVGGAMSSIGLQRAGYEVGRYAEYSFSRDYLAPKFNKLCQPDPRFDWYFQGLDAR
jgi:hypothetical protein